MAAAEARDDPLQGISYSGGRVFVRNTFLDLDDVPRMPELQRLKTAPARYGEEEEDSDPEQEEPTIAPSTGDSSSAAVDADGDAPPPMAPLYRTVTCNGWEDQHGWRWGGNPDDPDPFIDPNDLSPQSSALAPPPPTPSYPSATMGAMPMPMAMGGPGQPAGYMMVPANFLPPGCLGYGPMAMMPPNCQAVPIDPFARWPGGAMPLNMGILPGQGGDMQPQPGMLADTPATSSAAGYSGSAAAQEAPAVPPPAPLTRAFSVNSGIYRVHWTVDARKLKSNDKVAVSPQFELSFRTQIPFKMLIHPKFVSEGKGGGSFRKAKGRGKIELKCEGALEEGLPAMMTYRLSIGSGRAGDTATVQAPRGPVTHNFTQSGVSGLPKESEANPLGDEWEFSSVVDEDSQTFVVCLEIMPRY